MQAYVVQRNSGWTLYQTSFHHDINICSSWERGYIFNAVASMMPFFSAAVQVNYARYGLYYLRSAEGLPEEIENRFRNGESFLMRHKTGVWNAIWSDMFNKTTFMRCGHRLGKLVGITLSPRALKRWALSLHTCSRLLKDLDDLRDVHKDEFVTTHKEESDARIVSDAVDRNKLRDKLDTCINPLNPQEQIKGEMYTKFGTNLWQTRIQIIKIDFSSADFLGRPKCKIPSTKLFPGCQINAKIIILIAINWNPFYQNVNMYLVHIFLSKDEFLGFWSSSLPPSWISQIAQVWQGGINQFLNTDIFQNIFAPKHFVRTVISCSA